MSSTELTHRRVLSGERPQALARVHIGLPVRCCATVHLQQVQEAPSLPSLTHSLAYRAQRCIGKATYLRCLGNASDEGETLTPRQFQIGNTNTLLCRCGSLADTLDSQVADSTSRARRRQQVDGEEASGVTTSTSCVSIRHPSLHANYCDVAPCQIRRKERFYNEESF